MKTILKILPLVLMASFAHAADLSNPATCHIFDGAPPVTNQVVDSNKTKEKFELIVDRIVKLYSGTIADLGGNLSTDLLWDEPDINAYAQQVKTEWMLTFYGGLYRSPVVTDDAFALTVCHELGHHIGGAPFVAGTRLSVEGQADFWASSVCLKKYFNEYPETIIVKDKMVKDRCDTKFPNDLNEQNICYRIAEAGMSMATLFSELSKTTQPDFNKKNSEAQSSTKQLHPEAQCRLDTYISGSLCNLDDTSLTFEEKLLNNKLTTDFLCSEEVDGVMTKKELRPKCWFNELNNAVFTNYTDKVKSKSLLGLKGGKIVITYFNHLPGEYKIRLVPEPSSAFYVKVTSADFMTSLPASGQTENIVFEYKFMKRANRKLKFDIIIEYNGKVIMDRDNRIVINAFALVPY